MSERALTRKLSCFKLLLWCVLVVLLILLAAFVIIVSLFDLGVWTEFWDEVAKWMGGG